MPASDKQMSRPEKGGKVDLSHLLILVLSLALSKFTCIDWPGDASQFHKWKPDPPTKACVHPVLRVFLQSVYSSLMRVPDPQGMCSQSVYLQMCILSP